MKNLFLSILLLCCLSCDNSGESNEPVPVIELAFYDSLIFDGEERTYFVHLPESYEHSGHYPLLFAMHGGGLLGYEGIAGQSRLSDLADDENFIVVYPEGIKTFGFRTWNAGDCCPSATLLNTDDVGFIEALLGKLEDEWSIDASRIYAAGFSNGGQLAYKLANELPHKFAAVASVAGVLQDFPFNPTRNVPIIHFHSYLDQTAPYNGGLSDAPNIDNDFPSVEETLELIANQYGCKKIKASVFSNPDTYDHFRYSDCNDQVLVELYVSRDGGHSWPGGRAFAGVPKTDHFDASALMWAFFQDYELR